MNKNDELSLVDIQRGSFKVLLKIKEIFDNNNWKYYLAFGTLIGAIRHNGFIPWDDDIDIIVPRDDYEKFIQYCHIHKDELKPFELLHYTTNQKYIYSLARFSDSRYKIIYKDVYDYGLGLFVDIYPFDNYFKQDSQWLDELQWRRNQISRWGAMNSTNIFKKAAKKLLRPLFFKCNHIDNLNVLIKDTDLLAQKHNMDECDYFDCIAWDPGIHPYKKSDFGNGVPHVFNNVLFNIPQNYDSVLKSQYGDYMQLPPENQRIGHHYYKAFKRIDFGN